MLSGKDERHSPDMTLLTELMMLLTAFFIILLVTLVDKDRTKK